MWIIRRGLPGQPSREDLVVARPMPAIGVLDPPHDSGEVARVMARVMARPWLPMISRN